MLKDTDVVARTAPVQGLGQIQDHRAVELVKSLLKAPEAKVRCAAIRAVGIATPGQRTGPSGGVKDPDLRVRCATAEALEPLGDPRAVEPLVAVLNDVGTKLKVVNRGRRTGGNRWIIVADENALVATAAADALSRIGDGHALGGGETIKARADCP